MRPVAGPIAATPNSRKARAPESPEVRAAELRLALARLPHDIDDAIRVCRELTGLTAVASFRAADPDPHESSRLMPPMHPLCASRVRGAGAGPCDAEWQRHLRRSLRSRSLQKHVCPFGLRCSCIPVYYRGVLVGVAKCVSEARGTGREFSNGVQILDLAISKACQDLCVAVQASVLKACRERIERLMEIRSGKGTPANDDRSRTQVPTLAGGAATNGKLVDRVLEYIARHYLEHDATLAAMSRELGVTEKHVTSVFTRAVGQRMHAYVLQLRIQHACRLIVLTDKPIKQIAYESGFRQVDTFRRSFHRYVGVAPGAYRHAFGRS